MDVICQLVQLHTFVEYHHPTVKMIRVITAQLDVRSPSNRHGIAAYACRTRGHFSQSKLPTRSNTHFRRISSLLNKNDTFYNEIFGRQISVKPSCNHCTYILHISWHGQLKSVNSFRHGSLLNIINAQQKCSKL